MDRNDLISLIARLYSNNNLAFSPHKIFSIITGEHVTTREDYEIWISDVIRELNLVEGIDYADKGNGDFNIRGRVGLNILLISGGPIADFARHACDRLQLDTRFRIQQE